MTFDEALAYRKKMKMFPPDEQDFRHGWNAALRAVRAICDERADRSDECFVGPLTDDVMALEVEVQT